LQIICVGLDTLWTPYLIYDAWCNLTAIAVKRKRCIGPVHWTNYLDPVKFLPVYPAQRGHTGASYTGSARRGRQRRLYASWHQFKNKL